MNICSEDLLSHTIFGLKCDEKLGRGYEFSVSPTLHSRFLPPALSGFRLCVLSELCNVAKFISSFSRLPPSLLSPPIHFLPPYSRVPPPPSPPPISVVFFRWFADFVKTLNIIQRSSQLVLSSKINTLVSTAEIYIAPYTERLRTGFKMARCLHLEHKIGGNARNRVSFRAKNLPRFRQYLYIFQVYTLPKKAIFKRYLQLKVHLSDPF